MAFSIYSDILLRFIINEGLCVISRLSLIIDNTLNIGSIMSYILYIVDIYFHQYYYQYKYLTSNTVAVDIPNDIYLFSDDNSDNRDYSDSASNSNNNSEINESITDGNNPEFENTITDRGDSSELENSNKCSRSDSSEEETSNSKRHRINNDNNDNGTNNESSAGGEGHSTDSASENLEAGNNENSNYNNSNDSSSTEGYSDESNGAEDSDIEDNDYVGNSYNDPEKGNFSESQKIMDDLDKVDRAKRKDSEALEDLKEEYTSFFDNNSPRTGLRDLENYLEEEFPAEERRAEHDADAKKAKENASDMRKEVIELKLKAENTTDPEIKENIQKSIDILGDRIYEEIDKSRESEEKAKRWGVEEDQQSSSEGGETCCSGEHEEEINNSSELENSNKRSRSDSPEEEENRNKRQKLNDDDDGNDDDSNNSSGGTGPSTPSGPSTPGSNSGPGSDSGASPDSGPSNFSSNLSKIFIFLGGIFETISPVIENITTIM